MKQFVLQAPAKINLTLEVLGKRADGYHEIRSIIQTVGLSDMLQFTGSDTIEISSNSPGWEASRSLVPKAIELVQRETGITKGATLLVEKNIPLASGLGGDSSDVAAILLGLDRLWGLDLGREKLSSLALNLGSDVPFFLTGGTAVIAGRGEQVTLLPPLSGYGVILVMPDIANIANKTATLYRNLGQNHYTEGQITATFADSLKSGDVIDTSHLFNTFESVAFDVFPGLSDLKAHISKLGLENIHLSGSGPALFSLMNDREKAARLFSVLLGQGIRAWLVETPHVTNLLQR